MSFRLFGHMPSTCLTYMGGALLAFHLIFARSAALSPRAGYNPAEMSPPQEHLSPDEMFPATNDEDMEDEQFNPVVFDAVWGTQGKYNVGIDSDSSNIRGSLRASNNSQVTMNPFRSKSDDLLELVKLLPKQPSLYVLSQSKLIPDDGTVQVAPNGDGLDVTLVTQLSVDRVWLMEGLCSRWQGSVVAVIFIQSQEDLLVVKMVQEVLSGYNVNIVAAALQPAAELPPTDSNTSLADYPINLLRNLAISSARTSHYLLVDVDLWPSLELLSQLRKALRGCPSCSGARSAIVVPAFAIRGKWDSAEEIEKLTLAMAKNQTQYMPYDFISLQHCAGRSTFKSHFDRMEYIFKCGIFGGHNNHYGHSSTRIYHWWQQVGLRRLGCIESNRYEPYVVLPRAEAERLQYDTAFTGYGGNKIELILRLRLMGFAFYVIDKGFVFHHPHPYSPAKEAWRGDDVIAAEYRKQRQVLLKNLMEGVQEKLRAQGLTPEKIQTPCCPHPIKRRDSRGVRKWTTSCYPYYKVR